MFYQIILYVAIAPLDLIDCKKYSWAEQKIVLKISKVETKWEQLVLLGTAWCQKKKKFKQLPTDHGIDNAKVS